MALEEQSYAKVAREQGEVFSQLDMAETLAKGVEDMVRELAMRLDPVTTPTHPEPEPDRAPIEERKLTGGLASRLIEHNRALKDLQKQLRTQLDRLEL